MMLLEIAIVGASLSFVIQFIKQKMGTNSNGTKALTIVLALAVGGVVYFLQGSPYWETVVGILGVASTVYAFFLKE